MPMWPPTLVCLPKQMKSLRLGISELCKEVLSHTVVLCCIAVGVTACCSGSCRDPGCLLTDRKRTAFFSFHSSRVMKLNLCFVLRMYLFCCWFCLLQTALLKCVNSDLAVRSNQRAPPLSQGARTVGGEQKRGRGILSSHFLLACNWTSHSYRC